MDTDFSKIRKTLNVVYYEGYVLDLLAVVVLGYLYKPAEHGFLYDAYSQFGKVCSSGVIMMMLVSIPGALWWFKRQMKKVSQMEDEEAKKARYVQCSTIRVATICSSGFLAIIAFYVLGNYQPMLWCAGIAILAQFFCKPSDRKIYLEMNNKNEEDL